MPSQENCAMLKLFFRFKVRQRHSLQVKVYSRASIKQGFGALSILAHCVRCGI